MENENLSFKAELFFGRNWKFIFWGLILALVVVAWEINSIRGSMNELKQVVYENNSKVVLTTVDGRAIVVEKTPLKAEYLKQYATSIFVNSFIVSRSQLTDNFNKANIREPKDVLEASKGLGNVYLYYLDKEDKMAVGNFFSYINWLISSVAQNTLPEYINMRDYIVDSFEFEENAFTINISIKVSAQSYIISLGNYVDENKIFKIKGTGDFNLERSSKENPYGMFIKTLYIEPVKKPSR